MAAEWRQGGGRVAAHSGRNFCITCMGNDVSPLLPRKLRNKHFFFVTPVFLVVIIVVIVVVIVIVIVVVVNIVFFTVFVIVIVFIDKMVASRAAAAGKKKLLSHFSVFNVFWGVDCNLRGI